MSTSEPSASGLPIGDWTVTPEASDLEFRVKTLWGLVTVKGTFREISGSLHVDAATATGTMTIQSASLDTKHTKRDTHLRSADFFDVEKHPTLTFALSGAESEHGHVHLHGTLSLPGGDVPVTLHTDSELEDDQLSLYAGTEISRSEAHMTWNQMGMIRGDILLLADITLSRA